LGVGTGLLLGIVEIVFITYLYKWLLLAREGQLPTLKKLAPSKDDPWAEVRRKNRGFWYQELFAFDGELFSRILNAAFPLFLAELAVSLSSQSEPLLPAGVKLGIVLLFNPLPEIIMLERSYGIASIGLAFQFMRRHLLEWLIPILVLFLPLILLLQDSFTWFQALVVILASSSVLHPGELAGGASGQVALFFSSIPILSTLIVYTVSAWFSLFRIELYERFQ
jgi:hypothetical protein